MSVANDFTRDDIVMENTKPTESTRNEYVQIRNAIEFHNLRLYVVFVLFGFRRYFDGVALSDHADVAF